MQASVVHLRSQLTLLVMKMGYSVLATASRIVTGAQIDLAALDEACTMAAFSPLSGAALILEQYVLLARSVIEEMMEHLPEPYEASQGVVGVEARVQNVSFTDALAKHVVHQLTISHPLPILLQDCSVPLASYHPMVTLDMDVLLEMEAKVSYSLV